MDQAKYPASTGYMHLPPLWVVDDIDDDEARSLSATVRGVDLDKASDIVARQSVAPGIDATFARDGLVLFEYGPDATFGNEDTAKDALSARIALANAHRASLATAMSEVDHVGHQPVSINHLTAVHARDDIAVNDPVSRALIAQTGRHLSGWAIGTMPFVDVRWVPMRASASAAAAQQSLDLVGEICSGGLERVRRYDMLLRASEATHESNYNLALVTAWELIENAARRLWREYAVAIGASLGGKVTSKGFDRIGAEHLLTLLRMSGLPQHVYERLNAARGARNGWTHRLKAPSIDDALGALEGAAFVMALADNTTFVVPTMGPVGFTF
jgi:hypothetical protein